jgi:putative oxidoreductase
MKILTQTNEQLSNIAILLLRVTIGIILFGAGAGKVFSWFGGFGLQMTLHYFAQMGFSAPLAYLSTFTELIGGLLLILGLLTRPAAFAVMINMIVATVVTLPKGFFVGMAAYPFTLAIVAFVILLTGPMAYSIDALLFRKQQPRVTS